MTRAQPTRTRTEDLLLDLFAAGVDAVAGRPATARALRSIALGDQIRILAFGKAADAMVQGALPALSGCLSAGLVVTKYGHLSETTRDHPLLDCIESAHPVPDENSLKAGDAVCRFVSETPDDAHLLVLISGGGSALVESLIDGLDLEDLRQRTGTLISSGADIGEINRQRRELSRIKGGGLLELIGPARVTQLLISDVPGDHVDDIASGPFVAGDGSSARALACDIDTHIIASNTVARAAVAKRAEALGLQVVSHDGSLDGDIHDAAERLMAALPDSPGQVVIFGGEPTVVLPEKPGRGGRNQQLAALMAQQLRGHHDLAVLVCGTDGTDGPTDAAGGVVDCQRVSGADAAELQDAINRADTGRWLEAHDALVRTGPTGTNVMDLAIVLRLTV